VRILAGLQSLKKIFGNKTDRSLGQFLKPKKALVMPSILMFSNYYNSGCLHKVFNNKDEFF
tara:strand:+ start:93 stop:275 length:183 start_codon:yes stop_codon:yes gene_type:complete